MLIVVRGRSIAITDILGPRLCAYMGNCTHVCSVEVLTMAGAFGGDLFSVFDDNADDKKSKKQKGHTQESSDGRELRFDLICCN